mgnify:CR=1 FL=1|tara:strand:+ start:3938 stop:4789 length:852 start_codon:yes stop_codon:yes gene_type:complete
MAIKNPGFARYNSFQEFLSKTKGKDNHPSFTNLFSVRFISPPMMLSNAAVPAGFVGPIQDSKFDVTTDSNDLAWLLDYYADTVNLPSKQITTSQTPYVGSPFKYATNTAYSQISINFRMPRSQYSRNFFERWTTLMASDSEQYTRYYSDYVCPLMYIYKWERGGGGIGVNDPDLLRAIRENGDANTLLARKYQLTACWELRNLYPYNIGSVQLNNSAAQTMTLNIGFYYERYRFYTADQFDQNSIRSLTVGSNIDDVTTTGTSNNTTILSSVLASLLNVTGIA